jgi:hypothetical protein
VGLDGLNFVLGDPRQFNLSVWGQKSETSAPAALSIQTGGLACQAKSFSRASASCCANWTSSSKNISLAKLEIAALIATCPRKRDSLFEGDEQCNVDNQPALQSSGGKNVQVR